VYNIHGLRLAVAPDASAVALAALAVALDALTLAFILVVALAVALGRRPGRPSRPGHRPWPLPLAWSMACPLAVFS
jgi:hypothetical protein